MTIRRQYSLPNCTLILDGLSDGNSNSGVSDPRPLMSSLFNVECHFVGRQQPLLGGRDFLTSLVSTVSDYAQQFISGIHHPQPAAETDRLVSLTRGERAHTHYLAATIDSSGNSQPDNQPTQIELSTVELFDLLEAIDQFLADRRTLPDLMLPLKPVTKAIAQPISAQATPIGLGVATFIVASLVSYALPFPKVSPPKFVNPSPPVVAPTGTPINSPPAPTSVPQAAPSPRSALPRQMGNIYPTHQVSSVVLRLPHVTQLAKFNPQPIGSIRSSAQCQLVVVA